jgi:hypothetical protein
MNKLKSLFAVLALKNDKGDFFAKTDVLNKQVILGCNHKHDNGRALHSIEWLYDVKGEVKGIYDLPTTLLWAGEYNINDWIVWKTKLQLKKEVDFSFSWIHKLDKNLKMVWTDNINLSNLVNEPSKSVYTFGASFQWNL